MIYELCFDTVMKTFKNIRGILNKPRVDLRTCDVFHTFFKLPFPIVDFGGPAVGTMVTLDHKVPIQDQLEKGAYLNWMDVEDDVT